MKGPGTFKFLWMAVGLAAPLMAGGNPANLRGGGSATRLSDAEIAIERLSHRPDAIVWQAAIKAIQEEHPGRIVLESYGLSREGRTLNRLRILPWDADLSKHLSDQPAIAIVADLGSPASPESILQWSISCLNAKDAQGQSEIVIYPLPDPDGWLVGSGRAGKERSVSLQRNFPIGWSPWGAGSKSPGSAPLSAPETRALAQSLLATPRLVGLMSVADDSQRAQAATEAGSLERFAQKGLGLVLGRPAGASPNAWDSELRRMETLRPKLRIKGQVAKRLSAKLWMLDVEIENRGQALAHKPSAIIEWQIGGAVILANAWAPGNHDKPFTVLDGEAQHTIPAAGESLRLRLVLQVEEGAAATLKFSSPKLGTMTLPVELKP